MSTKQLSTKQLSASQCIPQLHFAHLLLIITCMIHLSHALPIQAITSHLTITDWTGTVTAITGVQAMPLMAEGVQSGTTGTSIMI